MLPNHTTESKISISIPWDSNTFRGFVGALCLTSLVLLLMPYIIDVKPRVAVEENRRTIPVELLDLTLGKGDKPGKSGGNASAEGRALKGAQAHNPLEDARVASTVKTPTPTNQPEYTPGVNPKPSNIASANPSRDTARANGSRSIGSPNGSDGGTGRGQWGDGPGAGEGIGIEWGGGGNRIVMSKVLPQLPAGSNTSTVIKLHFTVRPDGSVGTILPMQKGEAVYEQAAIKALRRWRFNALTTDNDMKGVITFDFRIL